MRAISVGEALGGPWAFSFTGWLVLFVPSTVLVVVQESATPFPNFGYVLASAGIQHLAGGLLALPAASVLRRRRRLLPLWSSICTWTAIGVARGLISGAMASSFAETSASFPPRVTVWLLVCLVWVPLSTYTAVQGQNRREILSALETAVDRRDAARRLQARSVGEIRQQLLSAVQTAVEGTIDDIRLSLAAARSSLDPAQLRRVGERLASVSRQAGSVVDHLAHPMAEKPRQIARTGAPLMSAHTFERRRPWVWSTVASAAVTAVLAPMCVRVRDLPFLLDFGVSMVVVTLVLALGSRFVPSGLDQVRRQVAWVVARYGAAGFIGALILTVLRWERLDSFTTALILFLPYGVAFSATVVSGAVGLAAANRRAIRSFNAIEVERAELEATAMDEENDIRGQLAEVMHGPILGRLSACAMALNFHAAEVGTVPAERTEYVAAAVVKHLDAATADLNTLIR